MPLQEKTSFLPDDYDDMSVREKNEQLARDLATAPDVTRKIVRIERIEIGAQGWRIHYRVGRP